MGSDVAWAAQLDRGGPRDFKKTREVRLSMPGEPFGDVRHDRYARPPHLITECKVTPKRAGIRSPINKRGKPPRLFPTVNILEPCNSHTRWCMQPPVPLTKAPNSELRTPNSELRTRMINFPKFSPRNTFNTVSANVSIPSTI